ncbi:hypothetical protein [Rhizocola hellebori]|uniref:hypothetical protein n=1 Tax=Rhizocola hellebori TaxID=1392758 RepID=UPI001942AAB4|nr:hypothetical protein [Rhizocola hellebori]
MLGILSVTGRLATAGLSKRIGVAGVTAAVFAVQAIGAAALPFLRGAITGAAACVVAFGLAFGVATIARRPSSPTATAPASTQPSPAS